MRTTSSEAYQHIVSTGVVSKKRKLVYQALYDHGPMTATQLAELVPGQKSPSKGNNVHARLCELREMGIVQELGEVTCPVTGRQVLQWDVTDNLPTKFTATKAQEYWVYKLMVYGSEVLGVAMDKKSIPNTAFDIVRTVVRKSRKKLLPT